MEKEHNTVRVSPRTRNQPIRRHVHRQVARTRAHTAHTAHTAQHHTAQHHTALHNESTTQHIAQHATQKRPTFLPSKRRQHDGLWDAVPSPPPDGDHVCELAAVLGHPHVRHDFGVLLRRHLCLELQLLGVEQRYKGHFVAVGMCPQYAATAHGIPGLKG